MPGSFPRLIPLIALLIAVVATPALASRTRHPRTARAPSLRMHSLRLPKMPRLTRTRHREVGLESVTGEHHRRRAVLTGFLAKHARVEGVTTLPGIQYRVLKSGPTDGAHPSRKEDVTVRYAGTLTDGTPFDSSASQPGGVAVFPLGRLIPGWTTALPLMRPGDEWEIVVPPEMAYGEKGVGPIPPNAVLIFDVTLVSIAPHVDTPPTPAKP